MVNPIEHGAARIREPQGGTEQEQVTCSSNGLDRNNRKEEKEEQEEEVKLISNIVNQHNDFEDDILPEFERFLSAEIEFDENDEVKEKDWVHESEKENDASELERLRNLVRELEEREVKLEGELLEYYGLKEQESNVAELQRQLQNKMVEIDMLHVTIDSLMEERRKLQEELADRASAKNELEVARSKIKELKRQIQVEANQTKGQLLLLKQQVSGLQAREEEAVKNDAEIQKKLKAANDLEVEVVELKRENKELQHEKRELTAKLNAAESRITEISNITENEMVTKAKEEVSRLTHANGDLQKQVEGLQMNRFSEVEELVYLRWVNACLRYELRNHPPPLGKLSARDLNQSLSPKSQENAKRLLLEYAGSERGRVDTDIDSIFSTSSSPGSEDLDNTSIDSSTSKYSSLSKKPSLIQKSSSEGFPGRRSASDRPRGTLESLMLRNSVDDVAITAFEQKDTASFVSSTTNASDAKSNMIGEIENRSSFLLAVKADVETQGDFVMSLATEVRAASFSNIEDLVPFVNWLDEELSFLVDERVVLKHFDWPEGKADALREAAFEYQDLMKLEEQVSTFTDDPELPCETALQKMYSLLEKVEQSVYALLRTRDMAISRYREFGIPVNWLFDSGVVGKIKLSSVQLARKYMKRVTSELDTLSGPEKEPAREFLILQGVRFAFRVHQFAGGFDAESMKAFEELRSHISSQEGAENKQINIG
ncbi:hypothetical protein PIB30_037537 [Stylosanthes scabra]|uniref:Protein CHUP1, chloroplastic n=1 Tax=Stylosanthes scabra TaxID=79078 RepID=A0ABU6RDT5_9FABA|nr:hypothetical protein [Stylosanthes scabra]